MKKTLSILTLGVAGLLLSEFNASAAFITSVSYDGHTYELWSGSLSWLDAKAAAEAQGGYLATLTTVEETTAVYNGLIGNDFFHVGNEQGIQAWLGGYTTEGDGSTNDPTAWAWVTGESWSDFDV